MNRNIWHISGQTNFIIIPLGHSSLTNYLAQDVMEKTVSASFIPIFIWYGWTQWNVWWLADHLTLFQLVGGGRGGRLCPPYRLVLIKQKNPVQTRKKIQLIKFDISNRRIEKSDSGFCLLFYLHLIFEISISRTWFFVYFELDFCSLHRQ